MNKYEKIRYLVQALNEWTKLYDEGCSALSDKEWDDLYFELQELEKETGLILSNSPTQTISYEIVNSLSKVTHNHPMLSLDKTKSVEEVNSFIGNQTFLAMCKMDGLTCSLSYRNGELVAAETRGNGMIGEDILHNVRVLPSVPTRIPHTEDIDIDGEIICTYTDFHPFSNEYKNPRNFAAGSIRLLDAKECAKRNLTFVVWDVITQMYSNDGIEYRLDQKLEYLHSFGFVIVPYIGVINGSVCSENQYHDFINELQLQAQEKGYPIDGVVFKFADCAYGRSLGSTTHHFKNALAYKFYDETYETRLINIEWTMGRTGVLTPVAVFESIDVDGSTIERASLHNVSILGETFGPLGPYKYQEIGVFKANMIIPQIAYAKSENLYEENKIDFPKVCPVCGGEVITRNNGESIFLVCTNPSCDGKLINRLDHFCGKKGLDMKGISKATLEKLIDWGWVNSILDLYNLKQYEKEWIEQPGFGTKSVQKILEAIEASRSPSLDAFICSLGIPLVGQTVSKQLLDIISSYEDFREKVEEKYDFSKHDGFGYEKSYALLNFDYSEADELYKLMDIQNPITKEKKEKLKGLAFCITGKLNLVKNRNELVNIIQQNGGKFIKSVSKNVQYLINNNASSSTIKNNEAKKLGIPIISEEDFFKMI